MRRPAAVIRAARAAIGGASVFGGFSARMAVVAAAFFVSVVAPPAASAAGWLAAVEASPQGQFVSAPQIVVDDEGHATAIWMGDGHIWSASRGIGGTWAPAVAFDAVGSTAPLPQLAVDGAGNLTAVWQRSSFGEGMQAAYR